MGVAWGSHKKDVWLMSKHGCGYSIGKEVIKVKYGLGQEDLKKIGIGLLVALGGAFLTYLEAVVVQINFGIYTPMVVAINGVIVNAGRKILDGVKK